MRIALKRANDAKSIHILPIRELGGIRARGGFDFQDHVAAGYLITMLEDPALVEVWCESQDDITLIWGEDGETRLVEFVQVKSEDPDHYWTTAVLCGREDGRVGTSVLERSLAHDECAEPCCFRLVTAVSLKSPLRLLQLPLDHPDRQQLGSEGFCLEAAKKVGDFRSGNGNGCRDWFDALQWDTPGNSSSVKAANLLRLRKAVEGLGETLQSDQLWELYQRLLVLVRDAAAADGILNPADKRVVRSDLAAWFDKAAREAGGPERSAGGLPPLVCKMSAAGLPDDVILTAKELRREYMKLRREPRYLDDHRFASLESEIQATLQVLRLGLDAGIYADDGRTFCRTCIDALDRLDPELTEGAPVRKTLLQGYMYEVTNRCLHRFRRAKA